jgi:hypothetical protein
LPAERDGSRKRFRSDRLSFCLARKAFPPVIFTVQFVNLPSSPTMPKKVVVPSTPILIFYPAPLLNGAKSFAGICNFLPYALSMTSTGGRSIKLTNGSNRGR